MILLFSVIHDSVITTLELNSDLSRIKQWTFQWKMSFNPDPNKQAQEVVFSRKLKKFCRPSLRFNNNVSQASSQKHLGLTLDHRLTFDKHLTNVLNKINKTMRLLRILQNILPRSEFHPIYECFIRPHLDYGDIIYDQAFTSPNLCLFLHRPPILKMSIILFSSNLNRLNALSACHKLGLIGNAQNLSLGFIYQNRAVEIKTAPQQHR